MNFDESLKKGVLFGFVPNKLELAGRPDLEVFPYNVMFMRQGMKDEQHVTATAVYDPLVDTHVHAGMIQGMRYQNIYGGDNWLKIVYDGENKHYHGKKYVNGKFIGQADGGADWQKFFVQLTALGLSEGEKCRYEAME